MRHSIDWQDDAINAAPEERATVGDLQLFLNDQNVTKHILDDKVSDHVTVALYGLVDGVVHDWWAILGARDREISLARYRTGYLLPDIRIQFDGALFEISAHQCAYTDPDLRFWGGTREFLSRVKGEERSLVVVARAGGSDALRVAGRPEYERRLAAAASPVFVGLR